VVELEGAEGETVASRLIAMRQEKADRCARAASHLE